MISCFSLVSLYGYYCRRTFTSSGLKHQSMQINPHTTISFWAPTPNAHSIRKPSLILIHGFGPEATWQWQYQVKYLSPYFNLYVPDLIFFGNSTTTSSERSVDFQAESIVKLLENLGVERYSLLGTSYGGFVAYHMARCFEERVEKVVIASSDVNRKRKDDVLLLERAKVGKIEDLMLPKKASQLRHLIGVATLNRPSYMPDFVLNDFIRNIYSNNLEGKKELLMDLSFRTDDQEHISPLRQEVLIVWGEHDNIFPLKKAIELKELLGVKVELSVIKNTAHTPQIEDPKYFNNIVRNFFSKPPNSICIPYNT